MQQKSSSMEHKAILLPSVMFWWGYSADDPYPLVVVSSSQRGNQGSTPPCIPVDFLPIISDIITWNMLDGEPTACIKFTNLYKKSRQRSRQQICRRAPFASFQSDPDQNQVWLGCIGAKWWDKFGITNFSLALSRWATSFDIISHLANEAIITFGHGTCDEYSTHKHASG